MLFTPTTSLVNQSKEKQNCLRQLQDIANLPVTASTKKRDCLEQEYLRFIYQQTFDSLFGGLIVAKNDLYYKPIITNLYLSELLITAGQVFCQGELLYVGKRTLDNSINILSEDDNNLPRSENYFDQNNLACYFSSEEINNLLDEKELSLFSALTSFKDASIIMSYIYPLSDAAEKINMHHKEAQIIEFNFRKKLAAYSTKRKKLVARKIDTDPNFIELLVASLGNIINLSEINHDQGTISKIKNLLSKRHL